VTEGVCQASLFEGLFPKKRNSKVRNDTDENGSNDGKVESEVLFSDNDIPGKSSDPRDFLPDHQKDPMSMIKTPSRMSILPKGPKPSTSIFLKINFKFQMSN